jgi:hypothetical protein
MKQLIFVITLFMISCCSGRKASGDPSNAKDAVRDSITDPACISQMIERFKAEDVQNPPRKIIRYTYRGKTVYYVPALCCDFYSELYDTNCKVIGHPDGGFTGRGDGTMTDFDSTKRDERLIWADKRGQK